MKTGYSTWGMPKVPLDTAIPHLARTGYAGVEITVIPGYTSELSTLTPDVRRHIRDLFTEHGLEMPAIAAHTSLLETDRERHAANMDRLRASVDLAVELTLGDTPPCIDTTPGARPEDWKEVRNRLVEETGALIEYAAERGVVIAMEPHVGCCLCTVERTLWLLEQLPSPYLKLNFDISHFDVAGVSTQESVAALAPHTVHTHVKDQRGKVPDFEFLVPGEGTFDYVEYLKAMQTAGYDGYITVEVSVMVQRRPDYDPLASADLAYRTLSAAFEKAGMSP
ncbi:MAG: sugar phosphate isomerase/epimerase [candidate division Zixibacteria bacterium]|nr:sugar phosphate isomerase/epimerase [candidate division Zixibacteria bacterium]